MVLPSQTGINVFRPSLFLALVMGLVLGLSACGGGGDVAPTPDVPASVQAGIAEALATPTPDISATVEAGVEATIQASQSSTHVPPTPSLEVLIQQARPSVVLIETDVAGGSGFIFETNASTSAALVLTNYHVIADAYEIWVTVDDSVVYAGSVIGVDAVRDLAVLEICCGQFNTLLLGGAEDLLPGMAVVTMGYPLGLEGEASTTTGIVSARRFDEEYNAWTIQTDAAINPGNSGGPLLSSNGYVVGINTFVYEVSESGRPVEAMGFAISEQTITPLLPSLKSQELVAVPTATPQPSVTGDVYTSQKYWYSLAIPRGWELYVESDEAVAIWDRWQTGAGVWVLVEEVDVDLYPTITSYAADWAPVAGEGMSNFGITSEGSIRTGKPNEAYEFNSSYLYDNEWWQSTDHWYLLGNLLITVEGSAVEEVWTLDYHSNAKQALLSTLESFNPSGYYAYRGWVYIYQVQYKLAIAEFDKAIDLDPTDADAYYSRGVAYGYLGEYQKAINDYTRVIELDPTYVEAYYNLGVSYDMLYESSKANQDYAKACELDSSFC